ncbi:MAG: hypothetical protein IK066_08555 [Kiritimatiellae bacterium]|nr:hypothetical protein [Kiritimatiellia bacterium]
MKTSYPCECEGIEDRKEVLRGVDELFASAKEYASSSRFLELMEFAGRFKQYAPYNAMLIYLQRPGARFVLSPREWQKQYGRVVLKDKRPILILAPNGPLRCLFDVTDTQVKPGLSSDSFPPELAQPFENDGGAPVSAGLLHTLEERLADLGICHGTMRTGENFAGKIEVGGEGDPDVQIAVAKGKAIRWRPAYSIRVSEDASDTAKFCSILHELGHLLCRHLVDAYAGKWKVRRIAHGAQEFEAESVAWLVARRQGVDSPSYRYLADYIETQGEIPDGTSVEEIMKAVSRIERMLAHRGEALDFFCAHSLPGLQGRVEKAGKPGGYPPQPEWPGKRVTRASRMKERSWMPVWKQRRQTRSAGMCGESA